MHSLICPSLEFFLAESVPLLSENLKLARSCFQTAALLHWAQQREDHLPNSMGCEHVLRLSQFPRASPFALGRIAEISFYYWAKTARTFCGPFALTPSVSSFSSLSSPGVSLSPPARRRRAGQCRPTGGGGVARRGVGGFVAIEFIRHEGRGLQARRARR